METKEKYKHNLYTALAKYLGLLLTFLATTLFFRSQEILHLEIIGWILTVFSLICVLVLVINLLAVRNFLEKSSKYLQYFPTACISLFFGFSTLGISLYKYTTLSYSRILAWISFGIGYFIFLWMLCKVVKIDRQKQ